MNVVHHVKGNYFDSIKELVDQEETVYAEPVIEILLSAIGEILSSDSNSVIKDVKDYLDKYYYEPLQVETVARQFSYTRTYLSNVFKRQYGVTIKEYILNKRLSEALSLIINGTSVSDASEQVGFSNVYNFSRSFKAKYGVSPNNYLKKV